MGKGCLKIHIAVDAETGKTVSTGAAEEDVHGNKASRDPVDGAAGGGATGVHADGAYHSISNSSHLSGRDPAIKPRKNSPAQSQGLHAEEAAISGWAA